MMVAFAAASLRRLSIFAASGALLISVGRAAIVKNLRDGRDNR